MSQENVEIVKRAFEAYVRGDAEQALGHLHPEVVIDFSARGDTTAQRGRDQVMPLVTEWTSTWDDYREELDEIRDLGDQVLVVTTQTGRGKGSGVEIANQWAFLVVVEDGLITRFTGYANPSAAIEAAGLSE